MCPAAAVMTLPVACLLAFLLGSLPTALLVVRLCKGVDVRKVGSGNVGATNASRAFTTSRGRVLAFMAIYAFDAFKGFAPAWFGPDWLGSEGVFALRDGVLLGASAVLGHVFTPWLRFRGGKGVATSALLALDWRVLVIALLVFALVRKGSGHVFLGSIAMGFALAGAAIALAPGQAFAERLPLSLFCIALALFLLFTHRSNLRKHFAARGAT
jgi:glycerol-3-phosphate acyltransferase PlsY